MRNPINVCIKFHRDGAKIDAKMTVTIEAESLFDFMRTVAPNTRVEYVESFSTGVIIWDHSEGQHFNDLLKIAYAFSAL